ncbi:MAG: metallophosphoesterase family protein [Candidatus Asgardarchaeia archaeon]
MFLRRKSDDFSRIKRLIEESALIKMVGSGDIHESLGKLKLFLRTLKFLDFDWVFMDGDYLETPAYMKVNDEGIYEDSVKKLTSLFSIIPDYVGDSKVFLIGGNYEIPGSVWDAVDELSDDVLFDIGCDKEGKSSIDKIIERDSYMGISTTKMTWEGRVYKYDKEDVAIIGVEGSNPINYTFPGERSEGNIRWAIEDLVRESTRDENFTIIATHVPPFGTRDKLGRFGVPPHLWGSKKGSTSLRKIVDEYMPDLVLSGHIHENFGLYVKVRKKGDERSPIDEFSIDFDDRKKVLIAYDPKEVDVCVCLNKGTLENWNWSEIKVAEEDGCRLIDIEGEWLRRDGKKKDFKSYDKILDFNSCLNNLL